MMIPLNLPPVQLKLTRREGKIYVWCILRKKELILTPEEWVRQHLIHYLIRDKKIPQGLMAAEMPIVVNNLQRRCDLVVFSAEGKPSMIVECKAPEIPLTEKVFHQIAQYNFELGVELLMVSNGLDHIICQIDRKTGELQFLNDLP
jgi:predicted type IV restriction endonuclease